MKWIEVSVTTNELASEILSEFLMEKGANGTEIVDAKPSSKHWRRAGILIMPMMGLLRAMDPMWW